MDIFTLNSSYETWEPAQFACLRAWDDAPGRFKRMRGCCFCSWRSVVTFWAYCTSTVVQAATSECWDRSLGHMRRWNRPDLHVSPPHGRPYVRSLIGPFQGRKMSNTNSRMSTW